MPTAAAIAALAGGAIGTIADGDLFAIVDVSDTTDSAEGTTKHGTAANIRTYLGYEVGTFTPGIAFGGGVVGITYTTQAGNYTKIGNRIMFDIDIVLSNKGTSTGVAAITGLPVAVTGPLGSYPVRANIAAVVITARTNADTTLVIENAAGSAGLTDTSFANNTSLRLYGQYKF